MVDISVIVPIYNAEKYLNKCIDSLVNQSKKELEFILINDGSTDKSDDIIKQYKDKRIKYFKNKNQGIGKTRNFGIDKSSGKYIMFVDSDDYLDKDACKLLFEKAENNKLDIVICDYYEVINNKIQEETLLDFKPTTLRKSPNLLNDINLSPWNKLYKKSLINENNIRFVENLKYEDAPFVCQALDKAARIGKVNQCLNYYVIRGNSETTVRDARIFDILEIVDKIRKYFKGKNYIKESLDKLTVRIITNYTIQQRVQIDKKLGIKFIDEAFSYLKKEVPDYKDNKYYENRGFLKRTIEKSKCLSKIYCSLYNLKKNKINFKNVLGLLFYTTMLLIFSYILLNIIFKNNNYLIRVKSFPLIISSIVYIAFIYLLYKLLNKIIKNQRRFIIITFILFIILQLVFAYIFAVVPKWDFGAVYESSIKHINGNLPMYKNLYYYRYGNNIGWGIMLTTIYRIAGMFGFNSFTILGIVGIIFNIICIDVSIIFIYKILRMYFSADEIKLFWLLTLMYTPFITYVPIFYTDTVSLPFGVVGIYFLLKTVNYEQKKYLNIILSGLFLGIGCCLKFSIAIIFIAFIIFYLIFFVNGEKVITKMKHILLLLLIFSLPLVLVNIYKFITFDSQRLRENSFPLTHWVMMGLTGNGGFNQADVDFTLSYMNKEEKKKANSKVIYERLNKLAKENKIISFYTNKVLYVWGDGTYYAPAKLNVSPIKNLKIKNYILPNNNKNYFYSIIAQTQLILVLLFIIIGIIFNKYLSKVQRQLQLFLNIIIFGVFIFFLIWEARSRYLVNIIPILLLSCYLGMVAVLNYVNRVRKVEELK